MDNFNVIFTKQTVFIFNLLFGVTGISMLVLSALIYADYHQFRDFIGEYAWIAPFFLICAGGIVFLITVLCCYGTIKENARMIQIFLVLLTWLFFFEIATAVVVYVKRNQFNGTLDNSFDSMLNNYEKNKEIWEFAQTELKCCGVNSPKDWTRTLNNASIPMSCCQNRTTEITDCTEEIAIKIGCKTLLLTYLERLSITLAGVGFGIGWIQIVVIGYSCFLFSEFRRNFGQFTQRLI
ncbi:tetraspanin-6-like isoform X2 [Sitodiplosis mosellana]|nr:tetraspanin-6-like isoform X2 [Sitodiplosis mosellana]